MAILQQQPNDAATPSGQYRSIKPYGLGATPGVGSPFEPGATDGGTGAGTGLEIYGGDPTDSRATDPSVATSGAVPHLSASQLPGASDTAGGQTPPPTPQVPQSPDTEEHVAPNGAHYTGPQYYQPDPSQPNYQPNTALPWAPAPTPTPSTPSPNISTLQLPGATDVGGGQQPSYMGGSSSFDENAPSDPNLRSDTYAPGSDSRLQGAQGATDAAAAGVQGTDRGAIQAGQEQKYRDIYGTGQVSAPGVDPNVQFKSIDPDVQFRGVDTAVKGGPAISTAESARTAGYGTAQDAALAALNGGPNRTDLANKTLSDFETQGGIDLANKFRDVGRTSAKFGRMGLGDVNSELGSIQGDYNRNLLQKRNELASSVAAGDIQDRLNRVNATSGLRAQEAGIDSGVRAVQAGNRDYQTNVDTGNVSRAQSERNAATDVATGNVSRQAQQQSLEQALNEANKGRQINERNVQLDTATGNQDRGFARTNAALGMATDQTGSRIADAGNKLAAARTLEDQIAGQGASNRNEMRTERGYQTGVAQQSIENRLAERKQQQAEKDARLRQAMAQAQAGAA